MFGANLIRTLVATVGLVALTSLGCTPPREPVRLPPGREGLQAWREARAALESRVQQVAREEPYTINVTLDLYQPLLGKRVRGRGAVAVRPGQALRMILLGPGGTTAMDLWVCEDAYRFAVPAIDLERRGDANTPAVELRGLPVAFLRWWFLRPLDGNLLAFQPTPEGRRYVLRDGEQYTHVTLLAADEDALEVKRFSSGDEESLAADGGICGTVHYVQRSTGIDIDVACEKLADEPPPDRAFADPDDPERLCGGAP